MRVLLLAALLPLAADAQTRYEWTGGDGDWSEATNWSPNGVPAATDTAAVLTAGVITLPSGMTTVAGLVLNTPSQADQGIDGPGSLRVTEAMTWTRGEWFADGTLRIASGATLLMDAPQVYFVSNGDVINAGTATWESGQWQQNDPANTGRFVNEGTLMLPMNGGASETWLCTQNSSAIVQNAASGVMRRTGTGPVVFPCDFQNAGTIRVEVGDFGLRGTCSAPITHTGDVEVLAGATFSARACDNTLAGGVTGEGTLLAQGSNPLTLAGTVDVGVVRINGGTLNVDGTPTIPSLELLGGALGGDGSYTVSESFVWTGGSIRGAGTTTVPLDLTFGVNNRSLFPDRILRLTGETTWEDGGGVSGGPVVNAGTMRITGAGSSSWSRLHNEGTLVVSGDGTSATEFRNTGTLRLESGLAVFTRGFDEPDTGRFEVAPGATLRLSGSRTLATAAEVVGTGTVQLGLNASGNNATWRPGDTGTTGVLAIDSDFRLGAEAVLDLEIGGPTPGTEHDQVAVSGNDVTLGGTLRVTLTGGYMPQDGDRFLILSAPASASGAFDTVELPDTTPAGYVQTTSTGVFYGLGQPVAGEGGPEAVPDALALGPLSPNPASGSVAVRFVVPEAGPVRIAVHDALGREVAVLVDRAVLAGEHAARLGAGLAPGVYVVRLGAGAEAITRTLTVVR